MATATIEISDISAARVSFVVQQKDDTGYWRDKSAASECDVGLSSLNYLRSQSHPALQWRLIKRVIVETEELNRS